MDLAAVVKQTLFQYPSSIDLYPRYLKPSGLLNIQSWFSTTSHSQLCQFPLHDPASSKVRSEKRCHPKDNDRFNTDKPKKKRRASRANPKIISRATLHHHCEEKKKKRLVVRVPSRDDKSSNCWAACVFLFFFVFPHRRQRPVCTPARKKKQDNHRKLPASLSSPYHDGALLYT